MEYIKEIVAGYTDSNCARYDRPLGLIGKEPDDSWGFRGKLCSKCYDYVRKRILQYNAIYIGGYSKLPIEVEGKLFIHLFDDRNLIVFKPDNKNNFAIYILADHLIDSNIITQQEKSLKRTIITAGISKSSEKKLLRIDFKDDGNKNESLILDIKDNLESAYNTIYLLLRKMRNIMDASTLNTLDQSPNRSISDKDSVLR